MRLPKSIARLCELVIIRRLEFEAFASTTTSDSLVRFLRALDGVGVATALASDRRLLRDRRGYR